MLGLDVGEKRIGVAKSDEAGLMAHGLGFIERKADGSDIERITELVREHRVETVVIGHPINMNGSVGKQAELVQHFAEQLKSAAGVQVKLWDERLSSKEAEGYLLKGDVSRKKRKLKIDQLAAQIILQSFMDAQGNHKS